VRSQEAWRAALDRAKGYAPVFELVKESVEQVLSRRRAGLSLALQEMPGAVGAYHALGSNFLVLNKRLLDAFEVLRKPRRERNALLYSLLLHEYLHSLGLPDEATVRRLVYKVSRACFGEGHSATQYGASGPWAAHPELTQLPGGEGFQIVPGLDDEARRYIA
jgi:hypothetical protein